MSDGPRPPAQVVRPTLPASFLERVRAAAEAEQRLEERAQERPEPPVLRPGAPRRPARFVRSRDWMARNADKKERGGGDPPGPGPQGGTAGDQSGTGRPAMAPIDLWTAGGAAEPDQARTPAASSVLRTDGAGAGPPEAAGPGAPPELPRRKPRVSHRRNQAATGSVAAVSTVNHTAESSTEPIPVIRVSATGEPLPPGGVDQGSPVPDGMPVTAAVQAPDQPAAPSPVEQALVEQAPVEQTPAARVVVPSVTPGMPLGHGRRSRGKAGLRARVARGMAAAPPPPAGPEVPERQDAGQPASQPAKEEAAAPGTAAADAPAPQAPAPEETDEAAEAARQAAADQAPADQAPADQGAADQGAADQGAADQGAADQGAAEQAAADQAAADQAAAEQAAAEQQAAAQRAAAQRAAAQRAAEQQAAAQRAAAQRAAERQAQQAAARRAVDEAKVQRAALVLARKSSPARTRRRVGLAAAVVLVVGGVATGFAFMGSGGQQSHRPSSDSAPTAVVNRDHAAAWVASQVSPATVVSCDPATCVLIESHGFPASHVRILGPGKGNPLVSNVVVATPAVRHQFGAQLTSVYAPGMLATFGSGSRQVDIQLVAPHGTAAYRAALNADLRNRRQSGAGLSGSNRIQAPFTARNQLAAGQVDSRLMITLALMASLHPVHLVAFGDGGPALDSAPLRSAELSVTGSAQKQAVLAFLGQQEPPYQPAHVTTRSMGRNRTLLIMEFTAPSPVGLFH